MKYIWIIIAIVLVQPVTGFAEYEKPSPVPGLISDTFQLRPWDLTVRAMGGYNDNVPLVADGDTFFLGETDSPYVGLIIDGKYRFYDRGGWKVGAGMRFDKVLHTDDQDTPTAFNADQLEYDVRAFSPSFFVQRRFSLGGKSVTLGANYTYLNEWADISAVGLDSHSIGVNAEIMMRRDVQFSFKSGYFWNNFFVQQPPVSNRDAEFFTVGLGAKKWFQGRSRSIEVGMAYNTNDAEGKNFQYDGYELDVKLTSQIKGPVWANVTFELDSRDYEGFVPAPTRTDQEIYTYGLQVIWVIDAHWTADAFFTHSDYYANDPFYEGDVSKSGAGISYRF